MHKLLCTKQIFFFFLLLTEVYIGIERLMTCSHYRTVRHSARQLLKNDTKKKNDERLRMSRKRPSPFEFLIRQRLEHRYNVFRHSTKRENRKKKGRNERIGFDRVPVWEADRQTDSAATERITLYDDTTADFSLDSLLYVDT